MNVYALPLMNASKLHLKLLCNHPGHLDHLKSPTHLPHSLSISHLDRSFWCPSHDRPCLLLDHRHCVAVEYDYEADGYPYYYDFPPAGFGCVEREEYNGVICGDLDGNGFAPWCHTSHEDGEGSWAYCECPSGKQSH